ncbi:unnamed protein product [Peronospora farinosa]|uniref:Reverse transcriptase domain-containing protein n=1 Tax=Peronospora farinosa TaxID=134698 RepID=A0ABN8BWE0_9STRA|nr:unnamed protein product [Peronospora farinosa]
MLWEWLAMPQGLKNAPATFNRVVVYVMRQHRAYAPHYFDDVFVHSRVGEDSLSAIESQKRHLDAVLQTLGKHGERADSEKVKAVKEWPVPRHVKDLRQFLG